MAQGAMTERCDRSCVLQKISGKRNRLQHLSVIG